MQQWSVRGGRGRGSPWQQSEREKDCHVRLRTEAGCSPDINHSLSRHLAGLRLKAQQSLTNCRLETLSLLEMEVFVVVVVSWCVRASLWWSGEQPV